MAASAGAGSEGSQWQGGNGRQQSSANGSTFGAGSVDGLGRKDSAGTYDQNLYSRQM